MTAEAKRKSAKRLFARLNKKFYKISGFDIVDNQVSTRQEVFDKAKKHIGWFRDWAEDMAQDMEQEMAKVKP